MTAVGGDAASTVHAGTPLCPGVAVGPLLRLEELKPASPLPLEPTR